MKDTIQKLKPRSLGPHQNTAASIANFESRIGAKIPTELASILIEIGNAVLFDNGAKFIPSNPCGREDANGYLSVEVFYGGATGPNGLEYENTRLEGQMPPDLIAIGEAAGGDQICLSKISPKLFFWKHDVEFDTSTSEIADDITTFLDTLKPENNTILDPSSVIAKYGIIEDKSFLDF